MVVTVLALALGVSIGLEPWRLALLGLSVLAGQLSIGISNDAIDAPRDRAVGRTDKPLAADDAPLRAAWIAAVSTAVVALALSLVLSWQMALAHAVFLASGWAYNAVLKSTVFSAACFAIGFGVFPSLAPLSLPEPVVAVWWAWVAGAVLGIAVHFSNVLPDLDDDARTGVQGLPHRIGRRGSAVVAAVSLVLGAVAVLVGEWVGGGPAPDLVRWLFFAAVAGVATAGLVAALNPQPRRAVFRLVMTAALLLAVELVVVGGLAG